MATSLQLDRDAPEVGTHHVHERDTAYRPRARRGPHMTRYERSPVPNVAGQLVARDAIDVRPAVPDLVALRRLVSPLRRPVVDSREHVSHHVVRNLGEDEAGEIGHRRTPVRGAPFALRSAQYPRRNVGVGHPLSRIHI